MNVEELFTLDPESAGQLGLGAFDRTGLAGVFAHDMGELHFFDGDGDSRGVVGGAGEGPGEYQQIAAVLSKDSTLLVFDRRAWRVTELTRSGEHLRAFPMPTYPYLGQIIELPDGTFAAAGRLRSPEHFVHPVARFDTDGELVAVFGTDGTERDGPGRGRVRPRKIAYHETHGLVALKQTAFSLEFYDLDGRLLEVWEEELDWFQWPPDDLGQGHRIGEPEHVFTAIQFDERGRLWVVTQVPDADWEEGLSDGRLVDRTKWVDYRIDVFSLEGTSPSNLCSVLFDAPLIAGFVGQLVVATYDDTNPARPQNTLFRLRLD